MNTSNKNKQQRISAGKAHHVLAAGQVRSKRLPMTRLLALLLALPLAGHAATIFSDNFDAGPQGLDTTPSTWFIDGGSVDIVGGRQCHSSPNCVNLDGHTDLIGSTESGIGQLFIATEGVTYNLSFFLAGSLGNDLNTAVIGLGDNSFTFLVAPGAPPVLHTVSWLATHGGFETFTFQNRGSDGRGAILDDVRLDTPEAQTTAPEPGPLGLIGAGLAGLGLLLRKNRRGAS